MFTWLFGDRGIPASYRHMDVHGLHTYQWVNAIGDWAELNKYHFQVDQGEHPLPTTARRGRCSAAPAPTAIHLALVEAIDRAAGLPVVDPSGCGSWPVAKAAAYRVATPSTFTKVWSHADYPLTEVGRLTLSTRNADTRFGDVEQAGLDPGTLSPASSPSSDQMLQGWLFAQGDAHRYGLESDQPHPAVPSTNADAEVHNYGAGQPHGSPGATVKPGQELRAQQLRRSGRDGPALRGRAGHRRRLGRTYVR